MAKSRVKTFPSGLRALQASGDGYWEMDLVDGSTWFSDWFYTRLGWDAASTPRAWSALRPLLSAADWEALLRDIRLHLEEKRPLETEIYPHLADGARRCWRIRGEVELSPSRKPLFLAGMARDVTAERPLHAAAATELTLLRQAFDGLPRGVALLDGDGIVVHANRRWGAADRDSGPLGEHFPPGANFLAGCALARIQPGGARLAEGLRALLRGIGAAVAVQYDDASRTQRHCLQVLALAVGDHAGCRALVTHETMTSEVN